MSLHSLWAGISYDALASVYALHGPRADWEAWLWAHPSASALLWEAAPALRMAFVGGWGSDWTPTPSGTDCWTALVQARLRAVLPPGAAPRLVQVTVVLPPAWQGDPEQALAAFDHDFWLARCELAEGLVVVDYEVQAPAGLLPFTSAYY